MEEIPASGEGGERIIDDSFMIFFNAHYELIEFTIPPKLQDKNWVVTVDTSKSRFVENGKHYQGEVTIPVMERSIVVLRRL